LSLMACSKKPTLKERVDLGFLEINTFLSAISLEIDGYELVESESVLPFYKKYVNYPYMVLPGEYSDRNPKYMYYDTYEHNGENYFYERGLFDDNGKGTGIYLIKGTDKIIEEDENGKIRDITAQDARYIDGEYLSKKSTSAKLIYDYIKTNVGRFEIQGIISFDDRVFLYVSHLVRYNGFILHYVDRGCPPLIFEYNYDLETVKYAGFLRSFDYWSGAENEEIEFMAKIVKIN